jgi:rhodanese-related sulfurtransferase
MVLVFMVLGTSVVMAVASEIPRISKEELKSMLGKPEVVAIDVRTLWDRKMSLKQIKGAVREDPGDVKSWAKKYSKKKTIVLYWAWQDEATSARVAQELIKLGFKKVFALKGGWNEWDQASYPTERK